MRPETLFLKIAVYLIGLPVLALCIFGLPSIAKEAAEHYQKLVYLPVVIGIYVTTIPFYAALYQTLRLLSYIDTNKAFSDLSVRALKNIKNCAITIGVLFSLSGLPLLYLIAEVEDAPGIILVGMAVPFASIVIAVFAAVLQRLLKNAIDYKAEIDLTV